MEVLMLRTRLTLLNFSLLLSLTFGYAATQRRPPADDFDCGTCDSRELSRRGYRPLVNAGGKCLDLHFTDMRKDGGRVQVWTCNGEPQQQWRFNGRALVNAGGKCLDAHSRDMRKDGGSVQVWTCNGEAQQRWQLR